jgi:LEA14-like dessication related protein
MTPRSLLLGSRLRVAATAVVVLALAVAGAFAVGLVGVPGVAAVDSAFGGVTEETTTVETDLVLSNPNPVGVRLGGTDVAYTVRMNDVPIAAGNRSGVAVERGNTTLEFTTRMDNGQIPPWWVSHVRNGETTTVTVDATVRSSLLGGREFALTQQQQVETDVIGQLNSAEPRPVDGPSSPLYSNPVLYVNETSAEWGAVTNETTPIDAAFVVYNPKAVPYTVSEIGYEVRMNGIAVGEGRTAEPYVIEGGTTETVETTPTIRNERLDEWWVSHLENDQVTELRIDFYARLELPGGETVRIPLDALTYERTIETDIFGNKDVETSPDGADTATSTPTPTTPDTDTDTATPTATPTDDDGVLDTPTPTPAPTEGSTPTDGEPSATGTPTPTPTDDGLL